ncbi:MAG: hypothetical protein KKH75_00520, partial [Actinobacteria bacterium]|nr:hypothetical protein [Actinomycetota bacterium]
MTYYLLRLLAKLIPGGARRQRFIEWARPRFSVQAIVDIALADRLEPIERAIYRTQSVEAPLTLTIDETLDALIDGRSI